MNSEKRFRLICLILLSISGIIFRDVRHRDLYLMRQEHGAVEGILPVSCRLLFVDVYENKLIGQSLQRQRIKHMRSYISDADDAYLNLFHMPVLLS